MCLRNIRLPEPEICTGRGLRGNGAEAIPEASSSNDEIFHQDINITFCGILVGRWQRRKIKIIIQFKKNLVCDNTNLY